MKTRITDTQLFQVWAETPEVRHNLARVQARLAKIIAPTHYKQISDLISDIMLITWGASREGVRRRVLNYQEPN